MSLAIRLSLLGSIFAVVLFSSTEIPGAQVGTSERTQARRLLLEASHLIIKIPEPQRSSAVANIASQLSRAGDVDDALTISQSTKNQGDQEAAMELIAWQLVKRGNVEQGLKLVDSMKNAQNREAQYGSLAVLLSEESDLTGALRIVQTREEPKGRIATLVQIAQQRARTKDFRGAGTLLNQAMQIANELVAEKDSNAIVLRDIATAQSEIGDMTGAVQTLAELSAVAHQYEGPEGNVLLLQSLGCAEAQVGDFVGALQTYKELVRGSNADIVLMAIAEEQAKEGLTAEALKTTERISDVNLRSAALRSVAIVRGKHGTLQDAIDAIDRIPDSGSRSEAIGALALEQAVVNNPAAALTAQRALDFANEVSSGSVSSNRGLEMIAVTRSVLGDFAGAEDLIASMHQPESRVGPLWNLTSMLAEAGRENEAVILAEGENAPLPKLYALLGTAQGLLARIETDERASKSE